MVKNESVAKTSLSTHCHILTFDLKITNLNVQIETFVGIGSSRSSSSSSSSRSSSSSSNIILDLFVGLLKISKYYHKLWFFMVTNPAGSNT